MNESNINGLELTVENERYFFEPRSGGIFQLSGLMRDILDLAETNNRNAMEHKLSCDYDPGCVQDSLDFLEREGFFDRGPGHIPSTKTEFLGSTDLYLQVSHRCNLRCTYCYAEGGHFGGSETMMSRDIAQKSVDFLFDAAGPSDICSLNFDGGEPFLNFKLVRHMVEYAKHEAKRRNRHLSLNISSNGTLLSEENVHFLREHRVSLGLSIDGDRSTHNLTRLTADGAGSYDLFLSSVHQSKLFQQLPYAQARGTITRETLHCYSTVRHLLELGFKIIYLEPVGGKNTKGSIEPSHLERLKLEFKKVAALYCRELLAGNMIILRNFFRPLQKIHSRSRYGFRCSAGAHTFAVSPGGDIYPCYKFVGMKEFVMGNVAEGKLEDHLVNRFRKNHVDNKESCRHCWARFLCGGGCPYLGASMHGGIEDINEIDCRFTRMMCRLALEIYIKLSRENPRILESLLGPKNKKIDCPE